MFGFGTGSEMEVVLIGNNYRVTGLKPWYQINVSHEWMTTHVNSYILCNLAHDLGFAVYQMSPEPRLELRLVQVLPVNTRRSAGISDEEWRLIL